MTTRDFTANVISATKVVPDGNFKNSKASGVWDINEALDLIKGGNWPNAANFPPESFVDGLFSCDLWDGGGSTATTITNGVDLSNKGGMVWIKSRTNPGTGNFHHLVDSERGQSSGFHKAVYSNGTEYENQYPSSSNGGVSSFNSNGFTVGPGSNSNYFLNASGYNYVSWTFRKQPKFFDVVTYTGDGNNNDGNLYSKAIPHNLGVAPHVIIIKRLDSSSDWWVKHKDRTNYLTKLNSDDSEYQDSSPSGANYLPIFRNGSGVSDATHFYLNAGDHTNGLNSPGAVLSNINNATYVAYLFAHNDSNGGFGEGEDQDIIKCGSYSGSGTHFAPEQDIGFEPQWLLVKQTTGTKNWVLFDNMRGLSADGSLDNWIYPNTNGADNSGGSLIELKSTGFKPNGSSFTGTSGKDFIYIAIRRGGMQTPTSASDVFQATASLTGDRQNGDTITTTLDHADWHFARRTGTSYAGYNQSRITGWGYLMTDANDAEATPTLKQGDDNNKLEYTGSWHSADNDVIDYFWKRAKGFLDIVTYTGTGSARTVNHNLGVAPEMMWIKMRSSTQNWAVYHKGANGGTDPEDYGLELNSNSAEFNTATYFNDTAPTSTVFTVGNGGAVNTSSSTYIAFLMATVAGVSKVGSYTGNGSSQDIDCGFSGGNGASFVMIKNADATGSWVVFDTARGLVTGNDVYIRFDVTNAEGGGYDFIDPLESGFTINQTGGVVLNESGQEYIFWAIA